MRGISIQKFPFPSHHEIIVLSTKFFPSTPSSQNRIEKNNKYLFTALKIQIKFCILLLSHPTQGGRIEIYICLLNNLSNPSHPTQGGRIEIISSGQLSPTYLSHPTQGGRIEIAKGMAQHKRWQKSHPTQGGRIEISLPPNTSKMFSSHPTQGGRIEMHPEYQW